MGVVRWCALYFSNFNDGCIHDIKHCKFEWGSNNPFGRRFTFPLLLRVLFHLSVLMVASHAQKTGHTEVSAATPPSLCSAGAARSLDMPVQYEFQHKKR